MKRTADALKRMAAVITADISFFDAVSSSEDETHAEAKWPRKPDFLVPNFDRSAKSGNFLVVWLSKDGPLLSDRCTDALKARAMASVHRRMPAWIVEGTEDQINALKLSLDYRDPRGFTTQTLDVQLRSVVEIKATLNQTHTNED